MANKEIVNIVAKNLSDLCEKKRDIDYTYSNPKIAKEMNIPYQTLNKYICGQAECSAENLTKIANYFNVSTDYLLGLTDTPTSDKDLRFVCEYTGLSQEFIKQLKNVTSKEKILFSKLSEFFINEIIRKNGD